MKKEIANLRNDYEKLKGDRDLMEEWAIKYGTESGRMYPVDEKDLFTLPPDEFEKKYARERKKADMLRSLHKQYEGLEGPPATKEKKRNKK